MLYALKMWAISRSLARGGTLDGNKVMPVLVKDRLCGHGSSYYVTLKSQLESLFGFTLVATKNAKRHTGITDLRSTWRRCHPNFLPVFEILPTLSARITFVYKTWEVPSRYFEWRPKRWDEFDLHSDHGVSCTPRHGVHRSRIGNSNLWDLLERRRFLSSSIWEDVFWSLY